MKSKRKYKTPKIKIQYIKLEDAIAAGSYTFKPNNDDLNAIQHFWEDEANQNFNDQKLI